METTSIPRSFTMEWVDHKGDSWSVNYWKSDSGYFRKWSRNGLPDKKAHKITKKDYNCNYKLWRDLNE